MKKIRKNLKWITIAIITIVVMGFVIIKYSLYNKTKEEEVLIEELELETIEKPVQIQAEEVIEETVKVYVDIKGAVNKPGVYEIEENKKVIDVVELAGGFTGQADTSMINLAKKVIDQMVIIIYTKEEVKKANESNTIVKVIEKECICPDIKNDACLNSSNKDDTNKNETQNQTEKININSATLEQLLTISGIGESKAKAIIDYREENGSFENIEDIMKVSGIGESLYEKIKDSITV